ncbi:MAG: ferritin-like domain-containing protein [Brevinematia bacterium]
MQLNSVELFKIAQQMEQMGIKFYEKAYEFSNQDKEKETFLKLAKMEREHLKFFTLMEKKAEQSKYCVSDEVDAYLKENFPSNIFDNDTSKKIGKELKSTKDIVSYAIEKEKDAIEYYLKLSKSVNDIDENSLAAIRTIIKEEESHIEFLKELL